MNIEYIINEPTKAEIFATNVGLFEGAALLGLCRSCPAGGQQRTVLQFSCTGFKPLDDSLYSKVYFGDISEDCEEPTDMYKNFFDQIALCRPTRF